MNLLIHGLLLTISSSLYAALSKIIIVVYYSSNLYVNGDTPALIRLSSKYIGGNVYLDTKLDSTNFSVKGTYEDGTQKGCNRFLRVSQSAREKREKMCIELKRIIKSMEDKYLKPSLDMVRRSFADWSNEEEADLVVRLIKETRSMSTYIPELELIMVNDEDEVIGYALFSGFHFGGKYKDELLLLSPVAVKIEWQRQHISKEIIEYGFEKAKQMGFSAVIVEGNPQNYRSRGFQTSADFGIIAGKSVGLPAPECLMVKELTAGALDRIQGVVEYTDYKCLR